MNDAPMGYKRINGQLYSEGLLSMKERREDIIKNGVECEHAYVLDKKVVFKHKLPNGIYYEGHTCINSIQSKHE